MKKHILLFFAIVCSLVTFAQKQKEGWDISVGASVNAPLAGNVDWASKAWGQNVNFTKKNMNVSFAFMQNKAGFVRMQIGRAHV